MDSGKTPSALLDELRKEAERIHEDALYSAKGHFSAATRWSSLHLWLGIPAALLAGVAGVSALAQFDNHNIVAGILALLVGALTGLTTFLNPSQRANQHLYFGNRYNALRNRARIFSNIGLKTATDRLEGAIKELNQLSEDRNDLNQRAPQIPPRAFARAHRGIDRGEAKYAVDESEGAVGHKGKNG